MLFGSSIIPGIIDIRGKQVQLGTIVNIAFNKSGLTADQWNNLPEVDRDLLLFNVLADLYLSAIKELGG